MKIKANNFRYFGKVIRAGYGFFLATLTFPIAWFWTRHPKDNLSFAVADILLLGFYGSNTSSLSARLLARQIRSGQVNGVFFVSQNVGDVLALQKLMKLFTFKERPPLVAIDHEGGIVQRLTHEHGMSTLPSARDVAKANLSHSDAKALYQKSGTELKTWGFNVNLGPVVDVDDSHNRAIGIHGRSFGVDSKTISTYAHAFVDGFNSTGIICALKHFPGHGRSKGNSHHESANISDTWSREELEPYYGFVNTAHPPMIMCGHLRLDSYEPSGKPATLSYSIITGLLRQELGFKGVVVTDDLDMRAVSETHNRREAVIEAIRAGNDLLMIKNLFAYDPLLPKRALYWIRQAIKKGQLQESQVIAAAERVRKLRQAIYT